ncbi:MAG: WecB/TagA/CpsF family glycosyltransferase [Parcubacteria group bacterium]|nr:WecB/TagA/CpsF family glycosyltransferase [Parcubacteria group bacterium]MBI2637220.1 WecB/TagA/CpsF family glycosyltransferase [Parcubacteria group bacterium]
MKSVNILGVEVSDVSRSEALAQVKNFLEDSNQHYLVTPNPEIVLKANKDHNLRRILNHADMALPDGFGLKIAARILGQKLLNRVTGADFMQSVIALAESEQWPVFLLGGRNEKISEQAAWHLRYRYKRLKIVGYASGGVVEFRQGRWQTSDAKLFARINQSRAKILFVGFGCPKQEKWIFQNLDKLPNIKLAMVVGGTLDFFAGERKRARYVIRRLGLEWLWRLIIEPTRAKRIWNATAVFVWSSAKWRFRMANVYRKNVVAAIVNQDNEFLLIKRSDTREAHWQFPQGGVDPGETEEQAVLREVREETGIANHLRILGKHPAKHTYAYPTKWHRERNGYKGQSQSIFYLAYAGDDSQIALDGREADAWEWVPSQRVASKVHEKRKHMANMVIEGFKRYAGTN